MKKTLIYLSILALLLASCKDKNAYTISGSFTDNSNDGKMVYLQVLDSVITANPRVIDSVKVSGSAFKMKGSLKEMSLAYISVGTLASATQPITPSAQGLLILEPGDISVVFNRKVATVGGTPKNVDFDKTILLSSKLQDLFAEIKAAGKIENVPLDTKGVDASTRMNTIMEEMEESSFQFTKSNMQNKIGEDLFTLGSFSKEQKLELLALARPEFRNKPKVKEIADKLKETPKQDNTAGIAIGQSFIDVQVTDAQGKKVSFSAFAGKGKVVLLDFWASWCGPCIGEMPHLVKAYAKYKNKGFEIVSISVDEDKAAWTKAIATNKMTWIQLIDTDKLAGKAYNVETIPFTVLLDKEGKIIAGNLRGEELEAKLAELLK